MTIKINEKTHLPFEVGDKILVRTVTMYQLGTVAHIGPEFLVLEDGGWVGDTGRLGKALAEGDLSEFERAPSWMLVGRGAIVDAFPWDHDVPKKSK